MSDGGDWAFNRPNMSGVTQLNPTEKQIVAWLRSFTPTSKFSLSEHAVAGTAKELAKRIERGEHRESDDA